MNEWLGFVGVILAAFIAAWGASGPTLSRRVKHHADLLTSLPEDMKEPLKSVLREELGQYAARERGRLYPSWRRVRVGRFLFDLVGVGIVIWSLRLVWTDPNHERADLLVVLSILAIGILIFDIRFRLFKPLPAGDGERTPRTR